MVAPGIRAGASPALHFFKLVLATWRLSALLVYDEGPGQVFWTLRDVIGGPLTCFWCASVWVAGLFALLSPGTRLTRFVLWLALAGGAVGLDTAREFMAKEPDEVI